MASSRISPKSASQLQMDQRAGNGEREDRFMFGGFTSTPFDIGDEYSFALTDLYEEMPAEHEDGNHAPSPMTSRGITTAMDTPSSRHRQAGAPLGQLTVPTPTRAMFDQASPLPDHRLMGAFSPGFPQQRTPRDTPGSYPPGAFESPGNRREGDSQAPVNPMWNFVDFVNKREQQYDSPRKDGASRLAEQHKKLDQQQFQLNELNPSNTTKAGTLSSANGVGSSHMYYSDDSSQGNGLVLIGEAAGLPHTSKSYYGGGGREEENSTGGRKRKRGTPPSPDGNSQESVDKGSDNSNSGNTAAAASGRAKKAKTTTSKKQPSKDRGLRHFSARVREKVEEKKVTTYNEVADVLVEEFAQTIPSNCGKIDTKKDNIRRRVYDALNVLRAMNIIEKKKQTIKWKGFPDVSEDDVFDAEQINAEKSVIIQQKQTQLNDLLSQVMCYRNLINRNSAARKSGSITPHNSAIIQLPFVMVKTDEETEVSWSMSSDQQDYLFRFSDRFSLHDDSEVLKHLHLMPVPEQNLESLLDEASPSTATR